MTKKFEFLEHTADTKIKAYGATLEEAFVNVVVASTSVMTNVDLLKEVVSKKVSVASKSKKSLLYDFLEEILFLLDTEGFLVKKVVDLKIVRKDNYELSCVLVGDYVTEGYDVHSTIKAITYSDMEIVETDGVVIQIVHDL